MHHLRIPEKGKILQSTKRWVKVSSPVLILSPVRSLNFYKKVVPDLGLVERACHIFWIIIFFLCNVFKILKKCISQMESLYLVLAFNQSQNQMKHFHIFNEMPPFKNETNKKNQTHNPTMMMIIWERGYHQFNQFLPERHTGIS